MALSLRFPPPGVTRHRVLMEPGLSSSRRVSHCRKAAIRPSGAAINMRVFSEKFQYYGILGQIFVTISSSPAAIRQLSSSGFPVIADGRKCL